MQSLETIGLAALSNAGDFRSSYELAARCIREGIPGDFVECGVFGGSQAAAMARAIFDAMPTSWMYREHPRVHLFDSFEGVPEPGPQDRDFVAGGHTKGASACSLEAVQANMKQWGIPDELLVYHKGVFLTIGAGRGWQFNYDPPRDYEAIDNLFPHSIALLRLDLDLYNGTLAALNLMYPHLSPGGFCIIDDYALDGCRQAVNEYMGGGFPPIYWQKQP